MDDQLNPISHDLIVSFLREALHKGEKPALTVVSNSMSPLLEVNDQVILSSVNFETLKKGDIITVTQREALTTHRVVWQDVQFVVTKGDRNLVLDEPTPYNQIIGKVSQIRSNRLSGTLNLEASQNQLKLKSIYRLSQFDFAVKKRFKLIARLTSKFVKRVTLRIMRSMKTL